MPTNDEPLTWADQSTHRSTRSTSQTIVNRFIGDQTNTTTDTLAVEEPLELQLSYGPLASRQVMSIQSRCGFQATTLSWSRVFS